MNRRPLVGGNWKMNLLREDAERYCRALTAGLEGAAAEAVIFPSAPLIETVAAGLRGSPAAWGGQDLHSEDAGAHTGDTSAALLADFGCTWALCGHSERRQDHGETDDLVRAKVAAAGRHRLRPLLCIGETSDQRKAGSTLAVLDRQLSAGLADRPGDFAVAYEPIWAIGTGETATPEIAQAAHEHIRETLADLLGAEVASSKRLLYGGSVNPDNASDLAAQPDVDGFLIGGASLDPERFLAIIRSCG